jgi:hypothetical protein
MQTHLPLHLLPQLMEQLLQEGSLKAALKLYVLLR